MGCGALDVARVSLRADRPGGRARLRAKASQRKLAKASIAPEWFAVNENPTFPSLT